jgi:hypothetical protein
MVVVAEMQLMMKWSSVLEAPVFNGVHCCNAAHTCAQWCVLLKRNSLVWLVKPLSNVISL